MANIIQNRKKRNQVIDADTDSNGARKISNFLYVFLLLLFFGVTSYAFIFSDFVTIKRINVLGNTSVSSEKILERVAEMAGGRFLGIFRMNTIIFFPVDMIKADLQNEFKEIAMITIKKEFPDAVRITIEERRAILVWCSDADCFLVDEDGILYASVRSDAETLENDRMIIFRDESGKRVDIGSPVVDKSVISFVLDMEEKMMSGLGIELKKEFSTPSSISGDIRAETQEGWKIIMNKDLGAEKEISMLQIALKNSIQDKQKDLEYIDLRSENRVYYKLKGVVAAEGGDDLTTDSADRPQ